MSRQNTDVIISAQVPREVAERLRAEARRNDRSTSGQLRALLRSWAAERNGQAE